MTANSWRDIAETTGVDVREFTKKWKNSGAKRFTP